MFQRTLISLAIVSTFLNVSIAEEVNFEYDKDTVIDEVAEGTNANLSFGSEYQDKTINLIVTDDNTLTLQKKRTDVLNSPKSMYGITYSDLSNGSLNILGHLIINQEGLNGNQARGMWLEHTTNATGIIDINLKTSQVPQGFDVQSYGVVAKNAEFDFSEATVNISIDTENTRQIGMSIENGAKATVKNLNIEQVSKGNATKKFIQGIYQANSSLVIDENLNISQTVSNGNAMIVRAINLEGSAYSQTIDVKQDLYIEQKGNEVNSLSGIFVSGDNSSSSNYHSTAKIGGDVVIDVIAENVGVVRGVHAQGFSEVNATGNLVIDAQAKETLRITGVSLGGTPVEGGVTLPGKLNSNNIDIQFKGRADYVYGISVKNGLSQNESVLINNGFTNIDLSGINATAEDADTVGIVLTSNNDSKSTVQLKNGVKIIAEQALDIQVGNLIFGDLRNKNTNEVTLYGLVNNAGQITTQNTNLVAHDGGTFGNVLAQESTLTFEKDSSITLLSNSTNNALFLNSKDASLSVRNYSQNLTVGFIGEATDQIRSTDAESLNQLIAEKFGITGQKADHFHAMEGAVVGDITADLDATTGEIIEDSVQEKENTTNRDVAEMMQSGMMIWNAENRSLYRHFVDRKNQSTQGAWGRISAGQWSADAVGLEQDYYSVQLGSDYLVGDQWNLGWAFMYADGDTRGRIGQADNALYSLAGYGTKTFSNDVFVSAMVRAGRVSTDMTLPTLTHKAWNTAYSVGVQTGVIKQNGAFTFEPTLDLTWSQLLGDDFQHNGVKYRQDDYSSLVGRLGASIAWNADTSNLKIWTRAALAHEFMGEARLTTSNATNARTLKTDWEDTWVEFGIGANYRVSEQVDAQFEVERACAADINQDWNAHLTVRYLW